MRAFQPDCFRCGDPRERHPYGQECRAVDADGRCPCPGYLSPAAAREIALRTRVRERERGSTLGR
jgi:hypothetical protein